MDALLDATSSRHPNGWPLCLAVCGQYEARQWFEHDAGDACRQHPKEGRAFHPPRSPPERHLVLSFEDTHDAAHPDAPRIDHIEATIAFVDALPADARLLVHCLQGLSRSTGLVLGLLAREVSPWRAGYLLHRLRPVATPNMLLVRLWDERLGLTASWSRSARSSHVRSGAWRRTGKFPAQTKQGRRLMRACCPTPRMRTAGLNRLMVAVDGYYSSYRAVHEAGLITHAISIQPRGGYHHRFKELLKNRAMVWLPSKEGQSLPQVVDDELPISSISSAHCRRMPGS